MNIIYLFKHIKGYLKKNNVTSENSNPSCFHINFPKLPNLANMNIVNDYKDKFQKVAITQEQSVK